MHGRIGSELDRVRLSYSSFVRPAVLLVALAILFWRTPISFTHPQFWGEDIFFYDNALSMGWHCVTMRIAGYLTVAQYLVGLLATPFDPVIAPAIFCYSAILLTLIVVWLVTSPRLDLPLKPLLAIAVVIVPMGREELGTNCNIQWILPIGAFAMLFMRSSRSVFILIGEAVFVALMAFSGPFSIFLAPMFLWQTWKAEQAANRHRFAVLTAIVATAAVIQASNLIGAPSPDIHVPYPWTLWITLPLRSVMTTFSATSRHLEGISGAAIGLFALSAAVVLACRRPYRTQKLFMVLFSLLIMFGGMFKFKYDLASQIGGQRYFYAASVFALWFLCCLSFSREYQKWWATFVIVFALILLPAIKDKSYINQDLEWPAWAQHASRGIPYVAPTWPLGFYFTFPAAHDGALSRFAGWVGRNVRDVATVDSTACYGTIEFSEKAPTVQISTRIFDDPSLLVWAASGRVTSKDGLSPELIAIADTNGTVLGFGLPGFNGSKWKALTISQGKGLLAYGVNSDSSACPLESVIP
jgi:hypothetical protein